MDYYFLWLAGVTRPIFERVNVMIPEKQKEFIRSLNKKDRIPYMRFYFKTYKYKVFNLSVKLQKLENRIITEFNKKIYLFLRNR